VATEQKVASSRRFWRIALVVLVVLPLLPEIVVLGASAIADLSGCRVDAPPSTAIDTAGGLNGGSEVPLDPWIIIKGFTGKACAIGPPVGSIIRFALNAGFFVGASFGSGFVVIWLVLCYFSITRAWTGFSSRLTLALLVCLIFAVVPYFGPMMSVGHLENPRCQPNEAGVGPCVVYGGEVGSIVHDNVVLGWQVLTGGPVAFGAFVFYMLFLLFALALRKRTRSV
jgi:hypothetical protein